MEKFWIVCRDATELRAINRHPSATTAVNEARRLSERERDRFLVFELRNGFEVEQPKSVPIQIETPVRGKENA